MAVCLNTIPHTVLNEKSSQKYNEQLSIKKCVKIKKYFLYKEIYVKLNSLLCSMCTHVYFFYKWHNPRNLNFLKEIYFVHYTNTYSNNSYRLIVLKHPNIIISELALVP